MTLPHPENKLSNNLRLKNVERQPCVQLLDAFYDNCSFATAWLLQRWRVPPASAKAVSRAKLTVTVKQAISPERYDDVNDFDIFGD